MNSIDYNEKKKLVLKIKSLNNKQSYIKLFKMLIENNIEYSSNNNGVFFNVNLLTNDLFYKISNFVEENITII